MGLSSWASIHGPASMTAMTKVKHGERTWHGRNAQFLGGCMCALAGDKQAAISDGGGDCSHELKVLQRRFLSQVKGSGCV